MIEGHGCAELSRVGCAGRPRGSLSKSPQEIVQSALDLPALDLAQGPEDVDPEHGRGRRAGHAGLHLLAPVPQDEIDVQPIGGQGVVARRRRR